MPGAGKTTVAVQLARAYDAVRMCPDEWLVALDERWRRIEQSNAADTAVRITRAQLAEWERFSEPPSPEELRLFDRPELVC
jgi:predicted kinase